MSHNSGHELADADFAISVCIDVAEQLLRLPLVKLPAELLQTLAELPVAQGAALVRVELHYMVRHGTFFARKDFDNLLPGRGGRVRLRLQLFFFLFLV